jgi:hypothetical protein
MLQFVTNRMDIGGVRRAEGYCNLQSSEILSTLFEITI